MNARTRPATLAEAAAIEVAAARAAGVYSTNWNSTERSRTANNGNRGLAKRQGAKLRYLGALAEGPKRRVDIAEIVGVSLRGVVDYCAKLEIDGLVTRSIRDGRAWLSITPAGTAWLQAQEGEA